MVRADIIRLPAFTAEFVILANAVTAITSKAENFMRTVSTPLYRPDMSTFLAAALTVSRLLEESLKFRAFFSLSNVPIDVATFRSN